MKPCKKWDKLPNSTGAEFLPSTVFNPGGGFLEKNRNTKSETYRRFDPDFFGSQLVPSSKHSNGKSTICMQIQFPFKETGHVAICLFGDGKLLLIKHVIFVVQKKPKFNNLCNYSIYFYTGARSTWIAHAQTHLMLEVLMLPPWTIECCPKEHL